MAGAAPDHIDLGRHRDWEGRTYERWLPNFLFGLICLLPLGALLGLFGQTPDTQTVANPHGMATMTLIAPTKIRSGLLFQARFDIHAQRDIKDAVLVLDSGWLESMTLTRSNRARAASRAPTAAWRSTSATSRPASSGAST